MTSYASMSEITFMITMAYLMKDMETVKGKSISVAEKEALTKLQESFFEYRDAMNARVDEKSKKRIMNKISQYQPVLVPFGGKETIVKLNCDNFMDMAEQVMESCCKGCDGKKEKCDIREAFLEAFIPGMSEGEDCPCYYMY